MKLKKLIPKTLVAFTFATVFLGNAIPVQAFTSYELDMVAYSSSKSLIYDQSSDLNYKYEGAKESEFYNHTGTAYNYNGAMPEYLKQMYGTGGQSVYNSNFGSNIVDLNGYGQYTSNTYGYGYGMDYGNYIKSVESNYFDSVAGGGQFYNVNLMPTPTGNIGTGTGSSSTGSSNISNSNNSNSNLNINYIDNVGSNNNTSVNGIVCDVTFPSYFVDTNNSFNNSISSNKDIKLSAYSDGRIGTITIENARLEVKAFDYNDIYQSMKKGVGHMDSTAYWNGNVTFFGHNRGSNGYLSRLKYVELDDIIEYKTKEGTKKYRVDKVVRIDETDWSDIGYSVENKITLITCVEDRPSLRLLVQGTEIR